MCPFFNNFGMENMVLAKVKCKMGSLFNIVLKPLKVEYWPTNPHGRIVPWGHDNSQSRKKNSLLKGQLVNWFSWSLGKSKEFPGSL